MESRADAAAASARLTPAHDGSVASPLPVWPYFVAFFSVGVSVTFAGPALSHLRDRVGTNDGGIALVFVGHSFGYMVGSVFGGRWLDRGLGHRMWCVYLVIVLLAIGVISQLRSLGTMVPTFVVLGMAAGAGDVSGNTLVVWARPRAPSSMLNALHLFFALGALSAPLMTNRAIAWSHSLWPLVVPLGVLAVIAMWQLLTREQPPKVLASTDSAQNSGKPAAGLHQLAVLALFFFVYVMLEIGFANWIHSYVEQIGYGGANTATGVTAIFWVGFSLGRLSSIWLARRFSAGWMLTGSMLLALVAAGSLVVVNDGNVGLWIVTLIFGLSIAPQFASMVGYAGTHFALSGAATSAFVGAAGLGGLVMPWVLGQLFDAHGPGVLPPITFASCVATIAAGLWVRHIVRVADSRRTAVVADGEVVLSDRR